MHARMIESDLGRSSVSVSWSSSAAAATAAVAAAMTARAGSARRQVASPEPRSSSSRVCSSTSLSSERERQGTQLQCSFVWIPGLTRATTAGGHAPITLDSVTVRALSGHDEGVDNNAYGDAGSGNVASTDAGAEACRGDPFLPFAAFTAFTRSARDLSTVPTSFVTAPNDDR